MFYNVSMMEEIGDIFSAGSGAVTKLTSHKFARLTNPKYPAEYIAAVNHISERYNALLHTIKNKMYFLNIAFSRNAKLLR